MTDPGDFFGMTPETVEWPVPDHRAVPEFSDSTVDAPRPEPIKPGTMKERLRALKSDAKPTVRDTRTKTAKPAVPNVPGQFIEPLSDFYHTMALALMPFKPEVSMVILSPCREATDEEAKKGLNVPTVGENCARAWDEAAQRSESIRRVLNTFTTVSVVGMIITAHMPIVMAAGGNEKLASMMSNRNKEATDA